MLQKNGKYIKNCEYCGELYTACFESQRFCSKNCASLYRYHSMHPGSKPRSEMLYTTCDMMDCQFYTEHRRNACIALHTIPLGECSFYKRKKNGAKMQKENKEE